MKQRVPVSQIMAKALIVVNPTKKISEVNQMYNEYGIRHIPVVDGSKIIGVISKNDVQKLGFGTSEENSEALNAIYDSFELKNVMVKNPITVTADTNIKDVAEIFYNQSFHSLPVIENEEIVGIVTTTDIVKYLLDQY
ncbi:CBS domain-containing protein [Paenimyroides tangerinum]|uniref:CBS domain-containing protein n=1 Tax=Paenimyroides tangerinum TaxID=2488728 RepID=A0A3P3WB11_9FLAO|nr:CBS domain-containing protein [Paenimyroides tangerinum]RRJ92372.1 CBS domain-containing protein [Paenimyroides tangerinum]